MSSSNMSNNTLITVHKTIDRYLITPFLKINDHFVYSKLFTAKYFSAFSLSSSLSISKVKETVDELHKVIALMETDAELINTMSYLTFKAADHTAIYTDMTNDMFLSNRQEAIKVMESLEHLPKLTTGKPSMVESVSGNVNKFVHDLSYEDLDYPAVVSREVASFNRMVCNESAVFIDGEVVLSSIASLEPKSDSFSLDFVTKGYMSHVSKLTNIPAVSGVFC
ncbi:hypothetical protein [Photobacterium leiognathi]|uniref:hypothetical protein n=1 Tax=Photobacterium leiognathi TaxID=553611 RepID=UPI002980B516|nr:hypothetical protein [Photobacterium leiognathi]